MKIQLVERMHQGVGLAADLGRGHGNDGAHLLRENETKIKHVLRKF